ncbi:hypothetical protein F5148DRAFT_1294070 [Russula earlei]|uniref:Uncharacterized protein n=1 Tax=Russula earlei TaxID=71964 RepID=A0ACC0TRX5_9AGAM|nr:hypothetical protein F5148DRAFT_1294070 [Russula earlei]
MLYNQEILGIVWKYIKKEELTFDELVELDKWLEASVYNQKVFNELTDEYTYNRDLEHALEQDGDEIWNKFLRLKEAEEEKVVPPLVVAYNYKRPSHTALEAPATASAATTKEAAPGTNKAVLTLGDGSVVMLDNAGKGVLTHQGHTKVIKTGDGQLAYENNTQAQEITVTYNVLSTPRGGQYELTLPDSTKVWLNNASSLRYPTNFTGKTREVQLTGEGYFEVSKNPNMPFRVKVHNAELGEDMNVEVLGTHFDISSYKDDKDIRTTLVEGSVKVTRGNQNTLLSPGDQLQYTADTQPKVYHDVNTSQVTSWKDGYFYFERADIQTVMKVLSRWYDIEVEYKGHIPTQQFGGKIQRNLQLSQVLKILKNQDVNYTIEGRKIIRVLLIVVGMGVAAAGLAQQPVHWQYYAKKLDSKTYEVHFKATISTGWHIYAQHQPDDAIALPSTITFNKNPLLVLNGKVNEIGKLEKHKVEVLNIEQYQYANQVEFVQQVKVKNGLKTNITGNIDFQIFYPDLTAFTVIKKPAVLQHPGHTLGLHSKPERRTSKLWNLSLRVFFFRASPEHEKQLPRGIANQFFNALVPGKQLLLTMKLTVILIAAFLLQAHAGSYSQTVTFSGKNIPLEKVFAVIEKQTGYVFFFNYNVLGQAKPVDLKVKGAGLQEVLKECFNGQPLEYEIEGKTISVKKKEPVTSLQGMGDKGEEPPAFDISGVVTDADGKPLEGISVTIKGEKKGIATNAKGEFTVKGLTKKNTILVFSAINYKPQEISIEDKMFIRIRLEMSTSVLDEIKTIGYASTTQRYSVGNVAKITADDIKDQPVSNPLLAMEGRVPGLVVTQSSGLAGEKVNVQIRGQNTLPSTFNQVRPYDNPLFIIDGVPFAPQNNNINQFGSLIGQPLSYGASSSSGSATGLGPFSSINPSDIESIEVLKDADATSIYGSRGANGVILITTKKGKIGKAKLSIIANTGASIVTHTMPLMNTQEYLTMRHEAFKNDGLVPSLASAPDLLVYDTTSYTDWKKYFFTTARTTDVNASLSGGTTGTTFFVSTGYHYESSVVTGGYSDNRASLNAGFHHQSVDQKLSVDFSTNFSYDRNSSTGNYLPSWMWNILTPNYPVSLQNPDGTLVWTYKGVAINNSLAYAKQTYLVQNYNIISRLQVGYRILPGLSIRSSFGYNNFNGNEHGETPKVSLDPSQGQPSSANFGINDFKTWIIEPQADYQKRLGRSKLSVLAGATLQQNANKAINLSGSKYANDALLGTIAAAGNILGGTNYSQYKYAAAFGRINYIWNDKYIMNVTGRRDGSSRFGPGKQFGNFWSTGAGWLFSQETFIKKAFPVLSYGKLRISYGTTGSDNIGDYQYLSLWNPSGNGSFQGSPVYRPNNLANPDYGWAINKKLEAGLELGFLQDRLVANISWYQNRCGNQLVKYNLPIQTGFYSVLKNFPAVVQNSGIEFLLNYIVIKTRQFTWSTSFNISIPKNKLLAFPGLATSPYSESLYIGKSISVIQGYRYIGVNDTTGVYQFLTAKGTPTYKPNAATDYLNNIGDAAPKFTGGWRNTISWKWIQLDVFLDFRKQIGKNYLGQFGNSAGTGNNKPEAVLARWQHPGDHSIIQQFTQNSGSMAGIAEGYFESSSGAYSDASFIRIKTVSLSYSFPTAELKKVGMQRCRIYMNAQNLFTITHYLGNDPETQQYYGVPPLKTIVAGVQLEF